MRPDTGISMTTPKEITAANLHCELRTWAKGSLTLEAATELLIRAGHATLASPWIRTDPDCNRHWIDFQSITENSAGLSGGQQRYLQIAVSLADGPVFLCDTIPGLDRKHAALVLAAVAHAAGFAAPKRELSLDSSGRPVITDQDALYEWPTLKSPPAPETQQTENQVGT